MSAHIKKAFNKIKIGVSDVVFELNYFKCKLAAILKRQYCHGKHIYTDFSVAVSDSQDTGLYKTSGFILL